VIGAFGAPLRWRSAYPEPWAHPVGGIGDPVAADTGATLTVLLIAAAGAVLVITWLVDRRHPRGRVPRGRTVALMAAIGTIALAITSPLTELADQSYGMHMVQHLLLTMVAAPLVVLGAPITLLMRVASVPVRRRVLLPMLHSRSLRRIANPAVGWLVFIGVTWGIHVGPLFAAALDDPGIHELEHVALLGAALLFWSPVVAVDPVPSRLDDGARLAYLALAMPLLSALGLLIYSWPGVLWADYAAHARILGLDALDDQRMGGMVMWLGSDLLMVSAFALIVISGHQTARHRRAGAWPIAFDARD
jgi:putative copper resistance protein D